MHRLAATLAAQLALVAHRTAPTAEARSALLDTTATPLARRYLGPRGGLQAVVASRDGRIIVGGTGRARSACGRGRPRPRTARRRPAVEPGRPRQPDPALPAAGRAGDHGLLGRLRPHGRELAAAGVQGVAAGVEGVAAGVEGVAAGVEGVVRRWGVADPGHVTSLASPSVPPSAQLHSVAYSADATLLAAGAADAVTRLWRLDGASVGPGVGTIPTGGTGTVFSLAFAPDGRTLAAGSADRKVYLWNLATDPGTTGTAPTLTPQPPITGPTGWVNAVAFSPEGARLAGGQSPL